MYIYIYIDIELYGLAREYRYKTTLYTGVVYRFPICLLPPHNEVLQKIQDKACDVRELSYWVESAPSQVCPQFECSESLLAAKASFTRVAAGERACSHGNVMLLYMYAHVPNLTIKSPYRTCIYVYVEWQGRESERERVVGDSSLEGIRIYTMEFTAYYSVDRMHTHDRLEWKIRVDKISLL